MVSTLLVIALSAALAGLPSDASLADGVKAYEEMNLELASDRLMRALPSASAVDRPRIELWLGIVELDRGNDVAAKRWLRSALKANPELTITEELSPKVIATIESVRDSVRASNPPEPLVVPVVAAVPPKQAAPAPVGTVPSPTPVASVQASEKSAGASPMLLLGTAAAGVAVASLAGAGVFGVVAGIGAEAAQQEKNAAQATSRYEDASGAAVIANAAYVAGGVAVAVGAVCGGLWLSQEEQR